MGSFGKRFREPPPDPLFWPAGRLLGAFWGHLWRPKRSQKGPENDSKRGSKMGLESRPLSRGGGGTPSTPNLEPKGVKMRFQKNHKGTI